MKKNIKFVITAIVIGLLGVGAVYAFSQTLVKEDGAAEACPIEIDVEKEADC